MIITDSRYPFIQLMLWNLISTLVFLLFVIMICYICPQDSNTEDKLSDISTALSVPLQRDCSCSFAVQRRTFSCLGTEDSQTVVFLAELLYVVLPGGMDVPSLITSWVKNTRSIRVSSIQLQVDSRCPVVIDSLYTESCTIAPPAALPTDVTVITVSIVVVGIVILIITVAIVTAVAVYCKRQSNYRYGHTHHHPVHVQSVVLLKYSSCNACDLVYTVVVYSSVLCSLLAVQTQPSPPQATGI